MKKIIFIISFLLAIQYGGIVYGAETNELLEEQEETLGISEFINEAEKYTKETFSDIDLTSIYENALSGNIEINDILNTILKLTGNEFLTTLRTLRIYLSNNNCT